MSEALVSVILPAYNAEKNIGECIRSLQDQTYQNIEIIVIDDGSTDGTAGRVRACATADGRVLYRYQENAGSGPARNRGLELSRGEWIMFVDADDRVDRDIVKALYDAAFESRTDLVCAGWTDVMRVGSREKRRIPRIPKARYLRTPKECRDALMDMLFEDVLTAPTRKLYSAKIIRQHGIQFPPLRRSEDIVFNYRYFDRVTSCVVLDRSLYDYTMLEAADMLAKIKPDYFEAVKLICHDLEALHRKWGYAPSDPQFQKVYNYCQDYAMLCIEANVLRGEPIDDILNDIEIQRIVSLSRPVKPFNRMFGKCFARKNKRLLPHLVRARIKLRDVKHFFGK